MYGGYAITRGTLKKTIPGDPETHTEDIGVLFDNMLEKNNKKVMTGSIVNNLYSPSGSYTVILKNEAKGKNNCNSVWL